MAGWTQGRAHQDVQQRRVMSMSDKMVTIEERIEHEKALTYLSTKGCKSGDLAKKIARELILTLKQIKAFHKSIEILQEGYAKLVDGKKVSPRVQNEETEAWEDGIGFVLENPEKYTKEAKKLSDALVPVHGEPFTDKEFKGGLSQYPPKPFVYVSLGSLFLDEEEIEKASEMICNAVKRMGSQKNENIRRIPRHAARIR